MSRPYNHIIYADTVTLDTIDNSGCELIVKNATKGVTGGVLTNIGNGVTEFITPGGGGAIYTAITHAALRALKSGSTLTVGMLYGITDFKTVYDQPDFDAAGAPKVAVTTKTAAAFETILLLATSTNTFASIAWSKEFPDDELKYDIDFVATEVMAAAAKGRIFYRRDIDGNEADFDFRTVLFKSYESATGSGIFNQWKDNGEASVEELCFGNAYGTALIKACVIKGFGGQPEIGALFGYPFLTCNIVINAATSALVNTLGLASRNCRFGDGLTGTDINSASDCIVGNDMRNFKNEGNISAFRAGSNTNTIIFLTGVGGFEMGDNNSNLHFKHGITDVVIGDGNSNWECGSEMVNWNWAGSDTDLSNISNLIVGNNIDGNDFVAPIDAGTHPELYVDSNEKIIFKGVTTLGVSSFYTKYFDGTSVIYTTI